MDFNPARSNNGANRVGIDAQPKLPAISQIRSFGHGEPGRTAVIEMMAALLGFLSVGLFVAHAFDAYRLR